MKRFHSCVFSLLIPRRKSKQHPPPDDPPPPPPKGARENFVIKSLRQYYVVVEAWLLGRRLQVRQK